MSKAIYLSRDIADSVRSSISRGKSILMLGPRQAGKKTFVRKKLKPDYEFSFADLVDRLRYQRDPIIFAKELKSLLEKFNKKPLIFIDEVQKLPIVMDAIQYTIDKQQAIFVITGSSARKLKHGVEVNLLPGRVVFYNMMPLSYMEMERVKIPLQKC